METPKILVVDDDESLRNIIAGFLALLNYEIIHACNGVEALEKTREHYPDVILLDVTMPEMDGIEVLKRLKNDEETSIIPVVMVTASDERQIRINAIDLGVDEFLAKPTDVMELRARVTSLLKVKAYNDYMRSYQKELETEVEKQTKDIKFALQKAKDSSYETIYILSRAAEYRDEDTGSHILRVSHYSAVIAEGLGQDKDNVENILYGALMHDVGKIGIPDRILLKPGELTIEEFNIVQGHVCIGSHILEGSASAFIKTGEEIARYHHEKWDGSGYPEGRRGLEIPLSSRIVAIADVFDALTTKRVYKDAFSAEKASVVIEEGRGRHLDPEIVEVFFALFDKVMKIKETYLD